MRVVLIVVFHQNSRDFVFRIDPEMRAVCAAPAEGADGQDRVTDDDARPESPAFRRASSGNAVGDMRGVQLPRKRGGEQTHAVQRTIVSQMFCEAIAVVNGAHRTAARAGI